ncbi:hypothetical protein ACYSNO_08480 [Enterococcus sp. LJL98]
MKKASQFKGIVFLVLLGGFIYRHLLHPLGLAPVFVRSLWIVAWALLLIYEEVKQGLASQRTRDVRSLVIDRGLLGLVTVEALHVCVALLTFGFR